MFGWYYNGTNYSKKIFSQKKYLFLVYFISKVCHLIFQENFIQKFAIKENPNFFAKREGKDGRSFLNEIIIV
jgi:hypothetical protein